MLSGSCNRCGACCFIGEYRCTNLEGELGDTTCKVYALRYKDMPISLKAPDGRVKHGYCLGHNTRAEEIVLTQLIRQGKCSYEEDEWQISLTLRPGA